MTLSRVSVTNATHRVAWCKIGQVEPTVGAKLVSLPAVLLSPTVVPPPGPPRRPHNALSNPLQSFSQRSPPPEPWKTQWMLQGLQQGAAGTVRSSTH